MSLDFGSILQYWPFLLNALGVTLLLSAASILCGLAIGLVLGTWRAYGGPVARAVLAFYIDSVRSIPILVVIIWTYFALPLLVGLSLQPMAAGIVALGFHLGAYAAETIRAGLTSVAARSDARRAGAGHEPPAGHPHHRPAAGPDPHAAAASAR